MRPSYTQKTHVLKHRHRRRQETMSTAAGLPNVMGTHNKICNSNDLLPAYTDPSSSSSGPRFSTCIAVVHSRPCSPISHLRAPSVPPPLQHAPKAAYSATNRWLHDDALHTPPRARSRRAAHHARLVPANAADWGVLRPQPRPAGDARRQSDTAGARFRPQEVQLASTRITKTEVA